MNDVCSSPQSPDRIATNNGTVPLITADVWESSGGFFRMEADIGPVIDTLGAGVYTVVVWGEAGGKAAPLTNYSIFVE